ncbi:phage portal protein [Pediococcus pentosaceus]|uniref:phage portal protein n=1 Tax=Pediococcus pentosaceus TaxID=1255 RepID=UPI00223C12BA|nr:phage portal protein [Pediococcus pentosaceus]MCS8573795.1 phage portal protein [Pediococcus pentosaceus]
MPENLISKTKAVLQRMNVLPVLNNVQDHKKVMINELDVARIKKYQELYAGNPSWKIRKYTAIDGQKVVVNRKLLNMPKITAKKLSSLVFNQKAKLDVSFEGADPSKDSKAYDNPANEYVHDVLKDNRFNETFPRWLEYMFGVGGIVILPQWNDGLKINFATADSFYPISTDSSGVSEAAIVTTSTQNGKYYTLFTWYEKKVNSNGDYIVTNQLYQSTDANQVGSRVPLSTVYPDLSQSWEFNNYSRAPFIYLKPNIANNKDMASPIGIPPYANAIDTLRTLDEIYEALFQEFRMGKRRITVPESMLKRSVDPLTGKISYSVDMEEEVYKVFKYDTNSAPAKPEDITLELRQEDIISALNGVLRVYAAQIGLSPGAFTMDEDGVQTATEVISQNSETYHAKNDHETLIEEALIQLVHLIIDIGYDHKEYTDSTDIDVSVNFDDSIAQNRNENLAYYMQATGNKPLMPRLEAIRQAFNLTDDEANSYLKQLQSEEPGQGDMEDIAGGEE